MPESQRRQLNPGLDPRLIQFSQRSWNAYAAIYTLQQVVDLLPLYVEDLTAIYGSNALGSARRTWGTVADLCSAITGLPATMATLLELGFDAAADVGHLIDSFGDLKLSMSPVLNGLDFRPAGKGDIDPIIEQAVAHDRIAKPLLELFRDEMRSFDFEALGTDEKGRVTTFGDLVHQLDARPKAFPWWEGRPLLMEEERAFLEYLCRNAGAEIVAEHLVDEELGMFILYLAGALKRSEVTGNVIINSAKVPHRLAARPVGVLCHQVGNTILDGITTAFGVNDVFDRLYVAEQAVLDQFDLDISKALETTRALATEKGIALLTRTVIDLRMDASRKGNSLQYFKYEFPDLGAS